MKTGANSRGTTSNVALATRRAAAAAILFIATALAAAAPAAAQGQDRFTLLRAIPDDVFVAINGRHNPERQFLNDYWGEVWTAFQKSGVAQDALKLVFSHLSEGQRDEGNRVIARFSELVEAVDWAGFGAGEMAFAERLPTLPSQDGRPNFGTPDIVVLFRVPATVAEQNYAGTVALLDALVEEINNAAGVELKTERTRRGAAELVVFDVTQEAPQAPRIPISVCRQGNVVMFALGVGLRDDSLALLAGGGSKKALADSPRLKAALAELPQAEDAITFFDMTSLRASVQAIVGTAFEMASKEVRDRVINARGSDEANRLNQEGFAAYEAGNFADALALFEKAHQTAPTDSLVLYNLACMHALLGHRDDALNWLDKAVDGGFHSPGKIASDADLTSLRDEPRFKQAVARARAEAGRGPDEWLGVARRLADRLFDSMGILDCAATVEYTQGYATYVDSIAVMPADARRNPLYPVVTGGTPVSDFATFLPEETISFSVNGGFPLAALYEFIADSFKEAGPPGEQLWAQWNDIQKQYEFDIHKDLIDWIDGAGVSASFKLDGADAWFLMLKVKDETAARDKLSWLMEFAPRTLSELAAKVPALMMIVPRCEPNDSEALAGFHNIYFAMTPEPLVCGVTDGWIIMGSSQDAVSLVLATAAGKHPNVRENERVMVEALIPKGPADTISFTDHRGAAEEAAQLLAGLSVGGGMASMFIPDEEAKKTVLKAFEIISRLAPVAGKIDFYKSSGSYSIFDGTAWRTRSVTHYVTPEERTASGSR